MVRNKSFGFGEPFPSVLIVNYDSGKIEQFLLKLYHFPSFCTMFCVRFVFASCLMHGKIEQFAFVLSVRS